MKPKTAFFLGALGAKLELLRDDIDYYCSDEQWITWETHDQLLDSVDKIRDLVHKIYDVENAEEVDDETD